MKDVIITVDLDEKAPDSLRIYDTKGARIGHDSVIVNDSRDNIVQGDLFSQPEKKLTYKLRIESDAFHSNKIKEMTKELNILKTAYEKLRNELNKIKNQKKHTETIKPDEPIRPQDSFVEYKDEKNAGKLIQVLEKAGKALTPPFIVKRLTVDGWKEFQKFDDRTDAEEYLITVNGKHFNNNYRLEDSNNIIIPNMENNNEC